MKCSLCIEDRALIKKSHIIPDFMYKGLFDDKHFIHRYDLNSLKSVGKSPSGIYSRHILCKKCDNEIIGAYESYASKILFGGSFSDKLKPEYEEFRDERGVSRIQIKNLDYNKFKLFLLSMLWRGHLSKNEFFENINLGPYAEVARKLILSGDAGSESEFETLMVMYSKDIIPAKSLIPARRFRMNGTNICYLIHIQCMSVIFRVSKGEDLEYFDLSKPRKSNEMSIYNLKGQLGRDFFTKTTGIKA